MPRIGIETLSDSFTQEDIEAEMNKPEWVLEGKIDGDNLLWSGDDHVTVPSGKIQDSPFNNNPIYSNKFFPIATSANFKEDIWDRLFNILGDNPMYTLATTSISFEITPNVQSTDPYVPQFNPLSKKELEGVLLSVIASRNILSTEVKEAIVEKPVSHRLLYLDFSEYMDGSADSFVISKSEKNRYCFPAIVPMFNASIKLDTSKTKGMDISLDVSDEMDRTTIKATFKSAPLDADEYIYLGLNFICLYEVIL